MAFYISSVIMVVMGYLMIRAWRKKQVETMISWSIAYMLVAAIAIAPMLPHFNNADKDTLASVHNDLTVKDGALIGYKLSPEAIWELGKPITIVEDLSNLPISDAGTIFLLSSEEDVNLKDRLKQDYTVEYLRSYDLNSAKPGTRGHKTRLTYALYSIKN